MNGDVVNKNGVPLGYVKVYNSGNKEITYTNLSGEFQIMMKQTDTIYCSFRNYVTKRMFFIRSTKGNKFSITIMLKPIIANSNKLYAMPKSVEQFKQDFMDVPSGSADGSEIVIPGFKRNDVKTMPYQPSPIANPISYIYSKYNKKAVMQRKLANNRKRKQAESMEFIEKEH